MDFLMSDKYAYSQHGLEQASPEGCALILEHALSDLGTLARHRQTLLKNPDRDTLGKAVQFNLALRSQYGSDRPIMVAESFATAQMFKYVTERAIEDQNGFLSRLVSFVFDAFKALWRKVSGFFKSSNRSFSVNAAIHKAEKLEETFEADPEALRIAKIEHDRTREAFGFLGQQVTLQELTTFAESMVRQMEQLDKLLFTVNDAFRLLFKEASQISQETRVDDIAEMRKQISQLIQQRIAAYPRGSKKDIEATGAELRNRDVIESEIFKLSPFVKGAVLAIWAEYRENDEKVYQADFGAAQKATPATFKVTSAADCIKLVKSAEKMSKCLSKYDERFYGIADDNARHAEDLRKVFDRVMELEIASPANYETMMEAVQFLQMQGKTAALFTRVIILAHRNVTHGVAELLAIPDHLAKTLKEATS